MDYYKIGQKIRKYRKAQSLSQESLAEKVGISVTHMSHIETGNTKLSLPVLVDLSTVLGVQTDDLLKDKNDGRDSSIGDIIDVLDSCDTKTLRVICDVIKATKYAMEKHVISK